MTFIAGTIVDGPDGAPIGGARVTVLDDVQLRYQTAVTQEDGAFRFLVPPGSYLVSGSKPGWILAARNVESGKTAQIALKRREVPNAECATPLTKPTLISGADPAYTKLATEREVSGSVVLHCTITVDGSVEACTVLRSVPAMDVAVVEAVQRRRYEPAICEGTPLPITTRITVELHLP